MRDGLRIKGLVIGIIVLFVGANVLPNIYADDVNDNKEESSPTFASDLIAYWDFNEGSGDIIHDSSIYASKGYIDSCNWVSGYSGTALEFPNYYSIVYGTGSLNNKITDYVSIEAWIKWYGPYSYYGFYNLSASIFDCRWFFWGGGGFVFYITNESKLCFSYLTDDQYYSVLGYMNIPIKKWTYVKAVFNYTSNLISLYVNNHFDTAIAITHPYTNSLKNGTIGNSIWAQAHREWRPFNGVIDELKIWRGENKNQPPNTPSITGKTNGKTGIMYNYTINTTDADQDKVKYYIDWGDNTTTITGFYESGKEIIVSHIWDTKGIYIVKVKAIDEDCAESHWETHLVTMPYSYNKPIQFFEWLFERFPNAFPLLRQILEY